MWPALLLHRVCPLQPRRRPALGKDGVSMVARNSKRGHEGKEVRLRLGPWNA